MMTEEEKKAYLEKYANYYMQTSTVKVPNPLLKFYDAELIKEMEEFVVGYDPYDTQEDLITEYDPDVVQDKIQGFELVLQVGEDIRRQQMETRLDAPGKDGAPFKITMRNPWSMKSRLSTNTRIYGKRK